MLSSTIDKSTIATSSNWVTSQLSFVGQIISDQFNFEREKTDLLKFEYTTLVTAGLDKGTG
jgi:hypothetical protein